MRLNLKKLRKDQGLTQQQLGKLIGVSASTVGMYEQGRRSPKLETLMKLSELFQKPIDELVDSGECIDVLNEFFEAVKHRKNN